MERTLDFSGPAGVGLFETVFDGLVLGGSRPAIHPQTGQPIPKAKDEYRRARKIRRKLETISAPAATVDPRKRPEDARDLLPFLANGAPVEIVTLEQGEIEFLEARILLVPWGGSQEVAVADALDFLSAAPEAPKE